MKYLLGLAVIAGSFLMAFTAMAAGIVGTKHDMTAIPTQVGALPGTSSICVYCHAPHIAGDAATPLWNKREVVDSYQPYASDTLDGSVSTGMGSITRLCLSCHDGSIAVYVIVTPPSDGGSYVTGLSSAPEGWNLNADGLMTGDPVMDHDFRNEHPVSITYSTRDRHLASPPPSEYPLFSGLVECSTCHNVHANTYPPFLRTSNDGSRMCLACHRI